jgi:hypothetical protein
MAHASSSSSRAFPVRIPRAPLSGEERAWLRLLLAPVRSQSHQPPFRVVQLQLRPRVDLPIRVRLFCLLRASLSPTPRRPRHDKATTRQGHDTKRRVDSWWGEGKNKQTGDEPRHVDVIHDVLKKR